MVLAEATVIEFKALHEMNGAVEMLMTEAGMVTLVSIVEPENELAPIVVTPLVFPIYYKATHRMNCKYYLMNRR
jgi:hypothetical protein